MARKGTFQFDLVVSGITREQAERLLDVIVATVEIGGGTVGGGQAQVTRAGKPVKVKSHDAPKSA